MFPFPYTGLRLVHDEKVRDAMERVRTDAELAGDSRRIVQMFLFRNVLLRIRSGPNIFALIEHRRSRRVLSLREIRAKAVNRAATYCLQAPSRNQSRKLGDTVGQMVSHL